MRQALWLALLAGATALAQEIPRPEHLQPQCRHVPASVPGGVTV